MKIPKIRTDMANILQGVAMVLVAVAAVLAREQHFELSGACAGLVAACVAADKWLTRCPLCGSMAHHCVPWRRGTFVCPRCGTELRFSDK